MANILKLSSFSKRFEKRAWHNHNAPKPANEKFENDPTKENCDAITKLAQEIYDCMPAGADKDDLKEGLDSIKASCKALFG